MLLLFGLSTFHFATEIPFGFGLVIQHQVFLGCEHCSLQAETEDVSAFSRLSFLAPFGIVHWTRGIVE